jgi:hypothetical protein
MTTLNDDEGKAYRARLFCDYREGMFAREELAEGFPGTLQWIYMLNAVAHHEAAHAVTSYALGHGILSVSLSYLEKNGSVAYGGVAVCSKEWTAALNRYLHRHLDGRSNRLRARAMSDAVATAAGPAAERKYCLAQGLPLRALGSADGDHKRIDGLGKALGNARFALQRCAWRRAQLALERPEVWAATGEIADWLHEEMTNDRRFEEEGDRDFSVTMSRNRASAICRKHGVRPGMRLWGGER